MFRRTLPLRSRNPVRNLMKQVGYGKGYQYAHDLDEKVADMECMPDNLRGPRILPSHAGRQRKIAGPRMDEIKQRKEELRRTETSSNKKNKTE